MSYFSEIGGPIVELDILDEGTEDVAFSYEDAACYVCYAYEFVDVSVLYHCYKEEYFGYFKSPCKECWSN